MKRKIATLFKELCCSQCCSDLDEQSISIMREEEEMIVIKIVCKNCGKSFGVAFLGISDFNLKNYDFSSEDLALKVKAGPSPINEDDVLDAHKFIKDFDANWQRFVEKLND